MGTHLQFVKHMIHIYETASRHTVFESTAIFTLQMLLQSVQAIDETQSVNL